MSWWSSFADLGFGKYNEQKEANERTNRAGDRIGGATRLLSELDSESAQLGRDEEGLSLQLADARQRRQWKPIHTPPERYAKYLRRGPGRGSVR